MQQPTPHGDENDASVHGGTPETDRIDGKGGPDKVVPIVEESLHVDTHETVTGKVRVHTFTDTVEELAQADLRSESVEVTRVPIDKVVDAIPSIRTENDVTIVPVLEEVLVVEKRLVLKEELHIRRRVESETFEVPVQLRKQRAVVQRVDSDDTPNSNQEMIP
jgi:stress response protein YsnF